MRVWRLQQSRSRYASHDRSRQRFETTLKQQQSCFKPLNKLPYTKYSILGPSFRWQLASWFQMNTVRTLCWDPLIPCACQGHQPQTRPCRGTRWSGCKPESPGNWISLGCTEPSTNKEVKTIRSQDFSSHLDILLSMSCQHACAGPSCVVFLRSLSVSRSETRDCLDLSFWYYKTKANSISIRSFSSIINICVHSSSIQLQSQPLLILYYL